LKEELHGFQAGKSCDSQLILTINDFANCLNENKQIDAVFLDFSKAFNRVPHKRWFHKLSHYGITSTMLPWIQDYLTDRSQNVILEGISSNTSFVTSGVPPRNHACPSFIFVFCEQYTGNCPL